MHTREEHMKNKEMIKLIKSGKLTRRQMLSVLATAGVGVAEKSRLQ